MWFVFPQLKELGHSAMARRFGINGIEEAAAYLQHPVLGPRLLHCTRLVLAIQGKSASEIFGFPDDVKLRSCMTLFEAVAMDEPAFGQVLDRLFEGERDERTLKLLR